MKAIRVTCPNCGATLRVAEAATTTSCEYCGTPSAIQKRTRILERIAPPSKSVPVNMPRAVQRHTGAWVIGLVLLTLIPVIVGGAIAVSTIRSVQRTTSNAFDLAKKHTGAPSTYVKPADRPPTWQGTDNLLVVDITGDGTPELVGRGRRVNAGDIIMLLGLDLATGRIVMTGETLGTYTDTYRGPMALAGDTVLFASMTGEVRGIDVKTGKVRWKATLDERTEFFCEGATADVVLAVGADEVIRPLALADGKPGEKKPAPPKRTTRVSTWCKRLQRDDVTDFERSRPHYLDHRLGRQLGLHLDALVEGPAGHRILSGARDKGTRVTTLVSLDPKNGELWRASPEGLVAEGAPRTVVVGDRETCIIYYGKDYRIGCFALADGKRLWDAEAPSFFKGLVIVGRNVIVTGNNLRVHDLDTGALRWKFD